VLSEDFLRFGGVKFAVIEGVGACVRARERGA